MSLRLEEDSSEGGCLRICFKSNSLENGGGAWDAFDAAMVGNGNGNDVGGIDWNLQSSHKSGSSY